MLIAGKKAITQQDIGWHLSREAKQSHLVHECDKKPPEADPAVWHTGCQQTPAHQERTHV